MVLFNWVGGNLDRVKKRNTDHLFELLLAAWCFCLWVGGLFASCETALLTPPCSCYCTVYGSLRPQATLKASLDLTEQTFCGQDSPQPPCKVRKSCCLSALLLAFCLQPFSGLCYMLANVFVPLWQNSDATYWFPSGGVTCEPQWQHHPDRLLNAATWSNITADFTCIQISVSGNNELTV